jgi:hypothetical protein
MSPRALILLPFLLGAETWNCYSVAPITPGLSPSASTACTDANAVGGIWSQMASYTVRATSMQDGTQTPPQTATGIGQGVCEAGFGVAGIAPLFGPGSANYTSATSMLWSTWKQDRQPVYVGTVVVSYRTDGRMTIGQVSISVPTCTCSKSDCCNAGRGTQCSLTCPPHQCSCGTGAARTVTPNDLCTPLLIDITGAGFHLDPPERGVLFDFFGSGEPFRISWPTAASGNGWLCLPDPVTGTVTSAKQLFGNLTPQPPSPHPNGFAALRQYDADFDGTVDPLDPIWPALRVWVDRNHDGISQPEELLTLSEAGITAIGVRATPEPRCDQWGDRFYLHGWLTGRARAIWDVWLVP